MCSPSSVHQSQGVLWQEAWACSVELPGKSVIWPLLLAHPQLWGTEAFKAVQYSPSGFKNCAWPQICEFFNRINPAQKCSINPAQKCSIGALFLVRQALVEAANSSFTSQDPRSQAWCCFPLQSGCERLGQRPVDPVRAMGTENLAGLHRMTQIAQG